MFKRILVPLDGSERAERALPVAARLARAAQGTIILARAVQVQTSITPYGELPIDVQQDALKARAAEAADYLTSMTKRADLEGITVQTTVRTGPAAWEMLAAAQEQIADLIVICSHGHTGFKRWVLGSVAQHIARHAQTPVLILREQGAALSPTSMQLESGVGLRVLVALDGSARALALLSPAMTLAQELSPTGRGALHLLFVVNPHELIDNDLPHDTARTAAQSYLARIAERLGNEDSAAVPPTVRVTWSVMTDSDTAAAIIQAAENGTTGGASAGGADADAPASVGYDVIAMATHGRTGVALWALGSVTERVVQSTQLPMLIVRAPEKTADETPAVHVPALEDTVTTWPGLL